MPTPRTALDALADTIERHYVFPKVARAVADDVRTWDVPPDEPPFEEWTRRLRAYDRHFRVASEMPAPPRRTARRSDRAPFVSTRAHGRVGVLAIAKFVDLDEEGRRDEVSAALDWLEGFDAAIVDVRGNGGGWPTMVAAVAGPLLGPDPVHVVDFRTRSGSEASFTIPSPGLSRLAGLPLAVLVDGGTASAAESFAYLMSTTGRAVVVGETSAGAANPGDYFDTGAGFGVFVSTGAPIDPRTEANWEGTGVVPDRETARDEAEAVAVTLLAGRIAEQSG